MLQSKVKEKRFKKGEWKKARAVLSYDIEAMFDSVLAGNRKDFIYHYRLLKGNLEDLYDVEKLSMEED
jgi:hypothetical protein